ncbi:MAG: metallophosphoesterase [Acidaminobacter sp.]|uniref:metallophosphoesterase family protein n=1 Tax=Acidaminobacter sp. TaxID=1872102 RepID=UPI001382F7AF|nr:metallophosphoesterase [Acidaminobacter sp.]MZQ99632.1 metallophosphoesterase [Acidaminobacter sp.]
MSINKILKVAIIVLFICLAAGISMFVYNANAAYKVSSDFTGLPLNFDPETSSSTGSFENSAIKVYGGFIKGIWNDPASGNCLVIRALSPMPEVFINSEAAKSIAIRIENINPDFYAERFVNSRFKMTKLNLNTLLIDFELKAGEEVDLVPVKPDAAESEGKNSYVILGDNRDGYDTFEQMIEQINGIKPVFVIDNGDLVFSGKPNQYRLFDRLTTKIGSTFCTTLGNHDIRGNGRETYTMLYGPPYYSFDFMDSHFIFLDSSPGWSEKKAISDEQYIWLENDMKKAFGKKLFVISHIPPRDPRSNVTKNEIANYVNQAKSGESWAEQKLDSYFENKNMSHGFQDPEESIKFEALMSQYQVDTVYLSHIHSNFEYYKDGVRYLISGGAGAELLTENSYYHYLVAKIGDVNTMTMVELPSPVNNYIPRYAAAVKLFYEALYKENRVPVILILAGLTILSLLIIIKLYLWKRQSINTFGKWLGEIGKFAVKRYKELYRNKNQS